MDWKTYYSERTLTAQDAVKHIQSGDLVSVGHAAGEPTALIDALVAGKDNYRDVTITHMVCLGKGEYCQPEMAGHLRHNSMFVSGPVRAALTEGNAEFTPYYFTEVPYLLRDGDRPLNVALVSVSPPDRHGYCSLGVSVDYTKQSVESAQTVIAQVNDQMPRTMGEAFVHVSEIDWFVEASQPVIQLPRAKISEAERKIGEHCAALIEDGSTLQLGIGALPDAILGFLGDKKDLGIHSEMISDGVMELVEAGVITGREKALHRGKIVVTFLMGSQKLYDFADDNPMIYMAPVSYTNNPYVIAQNSKMVAVNSCVQVDLMGQVCSESIGLRQISGVGGQVDFVRGANMAPGGKAIIALPSTLKDGKVSKIVPFLDEGAAVTTNRQDVNYIVTEYGIAKLRGLSLRERARALIAIAHPDHRPLLAEEYQRRFFEKLPV